MSNANANAAVVRRFVEEYQGTGKEEVALELLAPDFLFHEHKKTLSASKGQERVGLS